MKCTHPLHAYMKPGNQLIFHLREDLGDYLCTDGKTAIILSRGDGPTRQNGVYEAMSVPCGQCLACRINRSAQWAIRCQHEKFYYERACFITLTYAPQHVPDQLEKSHLQKFLKRLRKEFSDVKIRFFACGEYGKKLSRPHFHAIIFGIDFHADKYLWRKTIFGKCALYRSPTLERLWPFGFSTIGDVTFESAAYVARYCTKKINGDAAPWHYCDDETGLIREKEFQTQSLKPGLGYDFFKEFGERFFKVGYCLSHKKSKIPIPRYYRKLLEEDNPALLEEYKAKMKAFAEENTRAEEARRLEKFEMPQWGKENGRAAMLFRKQFLLAEEEAELSRQEEFNIIQFERKQDQIDDFLGELSA